MPSSIGNLRCLFNSIVDDVETGFLKPEAVVQGLRDIKEHKAVIPKHFDHFLKALYFGTKREGAVNEKVLRIPNRVALSYLQSSELHEHEITILCLFFGINDPLRRQAKASEVGKVCTMPSQLITSIVEAALTKIRRQHNIQRVRE